MFKQCQSCGEEFFADMDWKKICLDCWKEKKRAEEGNSQKSYKRKTEPKPKESIPPEMLKLLINLCHPDRHGGKDSATRATQWLLSLRGK